MNTPNWLVVTMAKGIRAKSYLEIGTQFGITFREVSKIVPNCVGVDIEAHFVRPKRNDTLFTMTSNAFFAGSTAMFDLIYLDGSHDRDQVAADFYNAKERLAVNGVIIVHDTLPVKGLDVPSRCGNAWEWVDTVEEDVVVTIPWEEMGCTIYCNTELRHV